MVQYAVITSEEDNEDRFVILDTFEGEGAETIASMYMKDLSLEFPFDQFDIYESSPVSFQEINLWRD